MNNQPVLVSIVLALLFPAVNKLIAQSFVAEDPAREAWVDSLYHTMDDDERLGQLFMIRAHSDKGAEHIAQVEAQIKKYKVGGLCFFQGTPSKQIELINRYQQLAQPLPLMVAIDGEWGLGMRMKSSTISFPRQLMLGAIQNNELIYDMGKEIAYQMKRVGININFAPDIDVNNNAANPVINTRSFGEDRYNVTAKGYQYMKGMQDHGVMACAKHFPGHGDTDVDSHHDLPIINHSRARLDSIELYPFKALAQKGVGSMMVAHLSIPQLDDRPNRPTTLSRNTVTNLLREELNFNGIIFTDALEMKGVTKYFKPGEVEAEALLAGNDCLLLPEDMEASLTAIKRYLKDGRLSWVQLEASVKRILRAKYQMGLQTFQPLKLENVDKDLNSPRALALKQKLIEHSQTLVRNKRGLLPFQNLGQINIASLSMGANAETVFQKRLTSFTNMPTLQCSKDLSEATHQKLFNQLKERDAVIISLHDMSSFAKNQFGITAAQHKLIKDLSLETQVILVVFGNPYSLQHFDYVNWLLEAYDEDPMAQDAAAQALFGAIPIRGRLPVTASPSSNYNTGIITAGNVRLGYALPESVGLSSDTLAKIDDLAKEAIAQKATPGCVVLVAKDGRIVFEKAYGSHTYAANQKMATDDIFDLASITKVAATTLSIMRLKDEGKIDINQPLSRYLPSLKGTNKEDLIIKEVMAHRAGLIDWIPFYKQTLEGPPRNPRPSSKLYRTSSSDSYSVKVTDHLFMDHSFVDSIWQQIYSSELRPDKTYKYSDLGFYMLAQVVEELTGLPLDQYVEKTFYRPLNLQSATFNPWKKFPASRIVPSENDRYWRRQEVLGYVHDMGAAMLGGVSGHAGLFANAKDLASIMELFLQKGQYENKSWIAPGTVEEFTTRLPNETRRAIGFDMLQLDPSQTINLSPKASSKTFGHLGFTGTAAWVDPVDNTVFIFLSNRTYPSMHNYKLNTLDIRPKIQGVIYDAMMDKSKP
ncbi:MAG: glycoside hydrolase family 3 N-terminal domain-containing protein [Saprospiraceae bacterium]